MRYLTFDIECCDGAHVCEFGYVITDEKFNIQEKAVLTINPDCKFRLTGRSGTGNLHLSFKEDEYYGSPLFTAYYDKIKVLLECPDQVVIGYSIKNDISFLKIACKRYGLDAIKFSFFDAQRAYSDFSNKRYSVSLETVKSQLSLPKPEHLHKSDDDALLTIQLVQAMCSRLDVSLPQLMELCPTACGISRNFMAKYGGSSLKEMLEALDKNPDALSNAKKKRCIRKFIKSVKPSGEKLQNELSGKRCCFSSKFEIEHIRQTLILIQLMKNYGCSYNTNIMDNDLYVATSEELNGLQEENTRYAMAVEKRKGGGKLDILTLEEFYSILGITEEELKTMSVPVIDEKEEDGSETTIYSTGNMENTIGALLKYKGVEL